MEFLADSRDEGADIGTKILVAMAGRKVLPVNQVIDLAIGHALAGPQRQPGDDLELGQGQIDRRAVPAGPVDVEAQIEAAETQDIAGLPALRFRYRPDPLGDQPQTLDENREAARLVDEIDGAALERRLLVDILAEDGEEDVRRQVFGTVQATV